MKKVGVVLVLLISISYSIFAEDEIDVSKAHGELVKFRNELKIEEAEKYYEELIPAIEKLCLTKRSTPACSRKGKMPRDLEEIIREIRSCVPAAKICSKESLDKESAEKCISMMERKCPVSKPNETGHPNGMARILMNAQERLPNLKYSSEFTPPHLAEAYNKCEEGGVWGYSVFEKKKPAKQPKFKITSMNPRVVFQSDDKWISVGEFKAEADCFEAKTIEKEKNGSDVSDSCRKRFAGKDVVVSVYEAKAMVKLSNYESLSAQEITFSTLEKCNENISKKRKYKFPIREYVFDEIEVGAYKSSDSMRFISECKEIKKVVCKNDDDAGFTKVEYFD